MNDLHWFPFYPSDWLTSELIVGMDIDHEGAYHRLLCYAWTSKDGTLPNDEAVLKGMAKWHNGADFSLVLKGFMPVKTRPDRLINPRLYREWQKAQGILADKSRAATVRWDRVRAVKAQRTATKATTQKAVAAQCLIPDTWQPTEQHVKLAQARGLDCNLEAAHFKGKAQEKQWKTKDWDLKFKNWLLQEMKFREQRRSS